MSVIRSEQCRRTETPAAVMTTLSSPTQGGAGQAVWRVDMRPGESGPLHALDAELVWTVLDGAADVELAGRRHRVGGGDTLVIPAGQPRQVWADPVAGVVLIGVAPAGVRAYLLSDATSEHTPAEEELIAPGWVC